MGIMGGVTYLDAILGWTGEETNETVLCIPMACMLTGRSFMAESQRCINHPTHSLISTKPAIKIIRQK